MPLQAHAYERRGLLAISPKAFFEVFFCDDAPRENIERDGAVIVDIRGPLEAERHPYFDSYPDIVTRIGQACESNAQRVVMRINSPGGEAAGLFEAVNQITALCAAANKPLYAFIDGDACSAAYAIATAASYITMGATALAGSIGVLYTRDDYSAANAARGIRVEFIASGQRKADGHPDRPLSDAEIASKQQIVDAMASTFFALVARRRGISPESIMALQGAVLHAQAAQAAGLIDATGSLQTLLADAASPNSEMNMTAYEKAKAALEQAAEGTDANAEAARRALAALNSTSSPNTEDNAPPPQDNQDNQDTPPADKPAEPGAAASASDATASAYRMALEAKAEAAKVRAELARRDEQDERARLIASRPDLATDVADLLRRAPISLVREHIASLPSIDDAISARMSEPARAPTQGMQQGAQQGSGPRLSKEEKADLDMRMGLTAEKPAVVNTPYRLTLGARVPESQQQAGKPTN